MRAKEIVKEAIPLLPAAAAAAPAVGAAVRAAIPKAIQFGKELYKKAATPATKTTTTPATTTTSATTPSSVIQVPQKVGGGARDASTQARIQTARTGEPVAPTSPQPFRSNRTNEPLDPKKFGNSKPARDEGPSPGPGSGTSAKDFAKAGAVSVGAHTALAAPFAYQYQKGKEPSTPTNPTNSQTPGSSPVRSGSTVPATQPVAAAVAPAAQRSGQGTGVVGKELAQASGGQFASRADRLNQ